VQIGLRDHLHDYRLAAGTWASVSRFVTGCLSSYSSIQDVVVADTKSNTMNRPNKRLGLRVYTALPSFGYTGKRGLTLSLLLFIEWTRRSNKTNKKRTEIYKIQNKNQTANCSNADQAENFTSVEISLEQIPYRLQT